MRPPTVELCPCGRPLHYRKPEHRRAVDELIEQLGPYALINLTGTNYLVPRHYVALHGFVGGELPQLAARYGWPIVEATA